MFVSLENINYLFICFCTGAFFIAALYHTVLYFQQRSTILFAYCSYLWIVFLYGLFRMLFPEPYLQVMRDKYNLDELIQMSSFIFYIRFIDVALGLQDNRGKLGNHFIKFTPILIITSLALQYLILLTPIPNLYFYPVKIIERVYLLLVGIIVLFTVINKRKQTYYKYFIAAGFIMIVLGFVSSVLDLYPPDYFMINETTVILLAYVIDISLFSSAMGYRIKQDALAKEAALIQLVEQQKQLAQKEIEKMEAVYIAKENERSRIAKDLHDDLGSELSSIHINAKVAKAHLYKEKEKSLDVVNKIEYSAIGLMNVISDIVWTLNSVSNKENLFKRIERLGKEWLSNAEINPIVSINKSVYDLQLSVNAQKNIWLIFKEAINNTCKYSKASKCYVYIDIDNDLVINIKDDGVGFGQENYGNGITNMKYRCTEIKGTISITTSLKSGTQIHCTFPLPIISEQIL